VGFIAARLLFRAADVVVWPAVGAVCAGAAKEVVGTRTSPQGVVATGPADDVAAAAAVNGVIAALGLDDVGPRGSAEVVAVAGAGDRCGLSVTVRPRRRYRSRGEDESGRAQRNA
jgi:hypothetical protein